jgi:hypothetical protein
MMQNRQIVTPRSRHQQHGDLRRKKIATRTKPGERLSQRQSEACSQFRANALGPAKRGCHSSPCGPLAGIPVIDGVPCKGVQPAPQRPQAGVMGKQQIE